MNALPTPAPRRQAALARLGAVLLTCAAVLLLAAGPASAHTRLLSTDPADGSTLDAAPGQISLTFNERMETEFATITVIGPDGADHRTGEITADDGTVRAPVELGAPGRYEIGYRVVSDDGHPIAGSVSFTLTAAGPAAGTAATAASPAATSAPAPSQAAPTAVQAAPAPTDDGGLPVWPWIVGAVVLVGVGVFAALRMGR